MGCLCSKPSGQNEPPILSLNPIINQELTTLDYNTGQASSDSSQAQGSNGFNRDKISSRKGPHSKSFSKSVLSILRGDFSRLFSKIRLVKKRLIFIGSSTFTDTHDIRNEFMKTKLPLLTKLGQIHGIDVIYIDMRYRFKMYFN